MERFAPPHRHAVSLVVCDNPAAGVIARAHRAGVPTYLCRRGALAGGELLHTLRAHGAGCIVLAGFLGLIPGELIGGFPGPIVNLHPALLPRFGGKGMFGHHVHRAVIAAGEARSGITIHHVNERYDEGGIIAQFDCPVHPDDTPDSLAERIHALEHRHLGEVVERLLDGQA